MLLIGAAGSVMNYWGNLSSRAMIALPLIDLITIFQKPSLASLAARSTCDASPDGLSSMPTLAPSGERTSATAPLVRCEQKNEAEAKVHGLEPEFHGCGRGIRTRSVRPEIFTSE